MVSEINEKWRWREDRSVLILVLVEDGLGEWLSTRKTTIVYVLILVLVEDGLGALLKQRDYSWIGMS